MALWLPHGNNVATRVLQLATCAMPLVEIAAFDGLLTLQGRLQELIADL